jgi:hypothetical protein
MTISPIQTRYAGCHFRSRTEARWAVVFDHFGIVWEYEPDGFHLESGNYLPDFKIIDHGTEMWVEIKPPVHTGIDPRWQDLVDTSGIPLWVLFGQPGPDHEQMIFRPGRRPSRRQPFPTALRNAKTLAGWRAGRSARFGT